MGTSSTDTEKLPEKRRAQRYRVKNPESIFVLVNHPARRLPAYVSDISLSGMMLLFKTGDYDGEDELKAAFNGMKGAVNGVIRMDYAQTRCTFHGQIRWALRSDPGKGYFYSVGIQFDQGFDPSGSLMAFVISDLEIADSPAKT